MAEQRFKATTDVIVADRAVKAGATFSAPAAQVADALARRLVEPAPAKPKRKRS